MSVSAYAGLFDLGGGRGGGWGGGGAEGGDRGGGLGGGMRENAERLPVCMFKYPPVIVTAAT